MQALRAPVATPAGTRTAPLCPAHVRHHRGRAAVILVRASKDDNKDGLVSDAIKAASGLVDKATDLVPESVSRPAAKAGVTIASVMFVFWLLQKVISGVVTLALFAGVAYYFITQQQPADGKDDAIDVTPSQSGGAKKGGRGSDDLDDPLAEARRIMDKYK